MTSTGAPVCTVATRSGATVTAVTATFHPIFIHQINNSNQTDWKNEHLNIQLKVLLVPVLPKITEEEGFKTLTAAHQQRVITVLEFSLAEAFMLSIILNSQ